MQRGSCIVPFSTLTQGEEHQRGLVSKILRFKIRSQLVSTLTNYPFKPFAVHMTLCDTTFLFNFTVFLLWMAKMGRLGSWEEKLLLQ